ncbi:MAG: MFS transporter [Anaerolineales bacterium]|nr:MFS transporter [Chloroflexota bacterium]MBL6983664.1 MFS transporter [Anaerolineales bacterium]
MPTIRRFLTPSYESNIPIFFAYQMLYNFMLFLPVWVIYIQGKFGLTMTEVTLNDSAFWITMALTEVPTGAVADTWGRKQSQLIGMIIATGSIVLFALAPVYPLVLVANSLWAIGITFISGAELALLYDTLRELGKENEYPKYRGRLQAMVLVSIAVSSVLGGIVGEISLVATFIITAGAMLIATFLVILLKEPPREPDSDTGENLNYWGIVRVTFGAIRQSPGLRYALLYASLMPLAGSAIQVTFMQPHAIAIGLPIAALGVIALGLRLSQFSGALSADRILQRIGEWGWLRLAPIVLFVGVIALGVFNSVFGIVLFALTGFASAVTMPLMESIILRQTPGSVRATILSVDSLLFRFMLAALGPAVGLASDFYSLPIAFIAVGVGLGFVIFWVMVRWRGVWDG